MEQQKILWVILSVAILLLAVLGSALFIFGPSSAGNEPTTIVSGTRSDANRFDPIEWARTGTEYPSLNDITQEGNADGSFVIADATDPLGSDSDKNEISASGLAIDRESGAAVVSLPVKKVEQPRVPAPAATPAPATAAKPATTPAAPATTATKPATTPAPATVQSVKEYWIQTNSFLTIARAEEERKVITAKGFPAVIQTRVDGDRTFYRVRVGSYATKAEAEKFLYWIKDIEGFEGSQIFEVTARREL